MNNRGTRRTRAHIIASQSQNFIEKFFIDEGHTFDRPTDYGTDLLVNTFDEEGYAENGEIRLQLKASDNLRYSPDGAYISQRIEVRHYWLWKREPMPVFLVLYDAQSRKAFWLYTQEYFEHNFPRRAAKTLTVRVPTANLFTAATVHYMQQRKSLILEDIWRQIHHEQ